MKERLQWLLENKGTPEWCGLLELISGQIGSYVNQEWDYDIVEKHHPNIDKFTFEDFVKVKRVEKIPDDWLRFVYACMKRLGL